MPDLLVENAPAKVNLTLRVLGRRGDGYHEIESLVTFADFGDRLGFSRGDELSLTVSGPCAAGAGEIADNLVLTAARALATCIPGLGLGIFHLDKSLPVAAGLGGGSADAAAALRLLARANGLAKNNPCLYEAARTTGADVPVCVDCRVRLMRGIGEQLSEPLDLPPLDAVLVNPGAALATRAVFAAWRPRTVSPVALDLAALTQAARPEELASLLLPQPNDLEDAAIALAPVIADVLAALRTLPGCAMARMSGSGSTCFALFSSAAAAQAAAALLHDKYPHWWVRAGVLGSAS